MASKIEFKAGVKLIEGNLLPESIRVLRALLVTAPPLQGNTVVITSASDGQHSRNSLHYQGLAWDVRFTGQRLGAIIGHGEAVFVGALAWRDRLASVLGSEYDVVAESDHIHIEYDPK